MKAEDYPKCLYNAQAVADEKIGLIVVEDVTNEGNDCRQLRQMLEQVEENLGETAKETVVDTASQADSALLRLEKEERTSSMFRVVVRHPRSDRG